MFLFFTLKILVFIINRRVVNLPLILLLTIRIVLNDNYRKNGFRGRVYKHVKHFYFLTKITIMVGLG